MLTNNIELRSYRNEICSHTHDFAQLVLPVLGSMELEVGHYASMVNNNIGVYIAPNEQHCFAGSKKNLFLVIDANSGHFFDRLPKSNTLTLTANTKKFIQFTHHYLVHNERNFFTDSLINQLLFHLAANSFSPEPDLVVMKAKHWIDANFTASVDVNRVAKYCHLSISQLQRRFKQTIGCSLGEYWRMNKLHHAKQLLSQKNCSIEAIAFEMGYENLSAFTRRFSKVFGQSPSQWRIKALNSKENA